MALIHCIYASAASPAFAESDLQSIVAKSREHNAALGVTGMLLYSEGSFFQVLEGEADVVDGLYTRIAGDARHERVTLIIREPVARRAFGEWTMGFVGLSGGEVASITGEDDGRGVDGCLQRVTEGRAKKLLAAFAGGRWRARVGSAAGATHRAA